MGLYFILSFIILSSMIGVIIYISAKNRKDDAYINLEMDEWDCPECGYHIQAGNQCIYCNTLKPKT